MFYAFLFVAGSGVGFLSGLLGIGGGIVMFPVLYYLPSVFGIGAIGVKSITGLTMAQGFFASLSAVLLYRRERLVNMRLVLALGLSLFVSSLAGALTSSIVPDEPLVMVFALMALVAAVMMFLPRSHARDEYTEEQVDFNRPVAVGLGLVLGFFLGMVGQGGAFLLIPVMLYVLRVPLRVAMGSMLAIGLFSATAGLAGKTATAQVPLLPAVAMLMGAVPAAWLGGLASRRVRPWALRWLLALVVAAAAVKLALDVF